MIDTDTTQICLVWTIFVYFEKFIHESLLLLVVVVVVVRLLLLLVIEFPSLVEE